MLSELLVQSATKIRCVSLILLLGSAVLVGCTGSPGSNPQVQGGSTKTGGGSTIGGAATAPPPIVTSVAPTSGLSSGGTTLTISGSNFDSAATVLIGGKAPTQSSVINSGTIQAVTPPHAAGLAEVQVRNPDGQRGVLLNAFTYIAAPPPLITFVSPSSGPSSGGTKITVNGRDFQQGAQIFVGGAPASSINFVNSNQIEGVTPPGPAGSAPVEVRNPDGQLATLAAAFDYTLGPAPTLSAVSPTSGPAAGGTTVNITGNNFLQGASVLFGGVASQSVTVVSATQIQAVTPSHSPGLVDVTVRNPDNQTATLVQRFSFLAPPAITSVSPTSGPIAGGTAVVIVGSNFQNGATAKFGSVSATSVTVVSAVQINAVTPPGAVPGAVDVTVTNPDGQTATLSSGFSYTVGAPPSLTSISPASGPTAGGTTVVLTGSNFQSGATVSFGSTPAASVTFVSATQVSAVTPVRTAGTVDVRITNPDSQSSTLAGAFTFLAAPVLTSVSPNFGPAAGGTSVTISGSGFQVGATVTFGGTAATNVMVLNPSQITANTPAKPAGAVAVRVTNPDAQFSELPNAYTYLNPPTVTSISPTSWPVAGGTTVTINGTNFQAGATVLFGGVAATSVTFVSSVQLRAVTPPGPPGPTTVQVVNPDGQSATAPGTYVPPPSVSSASPNRGPVAGNTSVVITGANFQTGAQVRFGATLAASVTFNSTTQLTATTPPGTAGAVDIVVTNPDGQSGTLAGGFVYELGPAPVVNGISPSSGSTAGNTAVTISGANFVTGAQVRIGGTLAGNIVFVNATQLTATTPAGTAGNADVQVTNPDLQVGTLPAAFTYVPPPVVSNVMPGSGPVTSGNAITVNGMNFQPGATVTIGGAPATLINFVSATQLTAIAPAGAAGAATVQVTNPDGQIGTLAGGYTFVAPPDIVSINPTNGPPGGATQVTVNGSGFQPGIVVFFGSSVGSGLIFNSSNQVLVNTLPRASGTVDVTVRNPDGQQDVLLNAFTYDPALGPMVTSVNPMTGPTAGGTLVTIMGSGFVSGASVWFGGNQGLNVAFISANEVRATTPAAPAGAVDVSVQNPNLEIGTLANAFTFLAPPTISTVSPNSGPAAGGTSVTITGSGFQNTPTVPSVLFGGAPAASVTFNSPTQLTVTTPAGTGTVSVQVTNADGQSATRTNAFTFVAAPTITNSTPGSGATAGGTQVTITGTGFQSGATVFFGATPAASVTFVSTTQLRATSPAGAAGTVDITVRNPDLQQAVRTNAFTFIPPPSIATVMPGSGPAAGGTSVTITGADFRNTPTLPTVLFGGTAATSVTFNSTMQLTAVTPTHAAGLVDVQVRNPDSQTATAANAFTFTPPPSVSGVSPGSGPTAGGTAVALSGSNFVNGATVRFGGNLASNVMFVSSTQLTANTPPGTAGGTTVQVTNPDGQSGSLSNAFTYVAPPGIVGISPTSGPTSGGTSVTISGSNFQSGAAVLIGGTAATSVTVTSPTQIQATTPSHAAGVVDVQVRNPDNQTGTLFSGFTFLAPPTISTISPNSGFAMGGTSVTISGTNFQPGATVTFGGTAATVTSNSPTQLVVLTPARTPGTVNVVVRNPDGQSVTATNGFTYVANPAPTISSVDPNLGPSSGISPVTGDVIVITVFGTNFQVGASVLFGGTAGVVNGVSPNQIAVVTPAHPPGTVNVEVRNPDGQNAILTNGYTFTSPPTVTGVTPNSGPTAGGTTVSITGTGFLAGAVVLFGGMAAPTVMVQSATQIQAVTPAAQTVGSVNVTVVNPDEQSGTLTNGFSYTITGPAPTVSAISPDTGPDTGGTSVIITGTNFQSGATVFLGGTAATVLSVSSTQIQATTPPHVEGPVNVDVRNPDAQTGRLSNGYTYTLTTIPGLVVPAAPELPRAQVDVTMPDTTGYVSRTVCASGCNFTTIQAAITDAAANCGSTGRIINVRAGETFNLTASIELSPHNCASDKWIIIQSDAVASLPPPGTRVSPADAPNMPTIVTTLSNLRAIRTPPGTFATRYRLIGLHVTHTQAMGELISLGDGSSAQNTVAKVPTRLIVDRCLIRGVDSPPLNSTRGVSLQCGDCAVIESHIDKIHGVGFDTQAIGGWNGTGPVLIRNNYLEAAGENIIFGGANSSIPNNNPSDITVVRNYMFKPLSWYVNDPSFAGTKWSVKNLFELKTGVRVLVEANIFENCFPEAQVCRGLSIKSSNSGGNLWALTSDVTIRYNKIINSIGGAINFVAWNGQFESQLLTRVHVHDNVWERLGGATFGGAPGGVYVLLSGPAPLGGPIAVRFEHNTLVTVPPDPGNNFNPDVKLDAPGTYFPGGISFHNNLFGTSGTQSNPRPAKQGCALSGSTSAPPWDCFDVPTGTPNGENSWFRNLVYYAPPGSNVCTATRPASTSSPWAKNAARCVSTLVEVGFVDAAAGNFRLSSSSPGKNAATTGRDVGADIDMVEMKTAGVKP